MKAEVRKAMECDSEGRATIAGMQIAKPRLVGEVLAYLDGPTDDPEQEQPAQEETWQPKLHGELEVVVMGPGEEAPSTEAPINREDVLKRAQPGSGEPGNRRLYRGCPARRAHGLAAHA